MVNNEQSGEFGDSGSVNPLNERRRRKWRLLSRPDENPHRVVELSVSVERSSAGEKDVVADFVGDEVICEFDDVFGDEWNFGNGSDLEGESFGVEFVSVDCENVIFESCRSDSFYLSKRFSIKKITFSSFLLL